MSEHPSAPESSGRQSVLIIDDEEDVRLVARMGLTAAGFLVLEAQGGREGIQQAIERAPSAIVLDIMMPQMDGVATLRELKANPVTSAIPVVFLTAKNVGGDADQLLTLGAATVVSKPFDPRALAEQVKMLVDS